jgi:hypothetical protein
MADRLTSWFYRPTTTRTEALEVVADLLCALDTARITINAMPHGENCFLHSDGGEFDACRCGKDAVVRFLDVTHEQLPQYDAAIAKATGAAS